MLYVVVPEVFYMSWWFMRVFLFHVMVVHVFFHDHGGSCFPCFFTCHGGSCLFMAWLFMFFHVMAVHVFSCHGGSCFFHVMVVHVSQGPWL